MKSSAADLLILPEMYNFIHETEKPAGHVTMGRKLETKSTGT